MKQSIPMASWEMKNLYPSKMTDLEVLIQPVRARGIVSCETWLTALSPHTRATCKQTLRL